MRARTTLRVKAVRPQGLLEVAAQTTKPARAVKVTARKAARVLKAAARKAAQRVRRAEEELKTPAQAAKAEAGRRRWAPRVRSRATVRSGIASTACVVRVPARAAKRAPMT